MSSLLQQLNGDLATLVTGVRRSLVQVRDGRGGAGAGTVWHSDGLIVTNAHVIARGGPLKVHLPTGESYDARVLARDDENDLAALAIEANGLPVIQPGDSRQVYAGQWVMALGHPWGVLDAVTGGIVIGAGRDVVELNGTGRDWLAVSLHLRPGHSGGPLVDVQGRMVGVNTLMTGPDVGVAVPVDSVKQFLKQKLGQVAPRVHPDVRPEPTPAPVTEFV